MRAEIAHFKSDPIGRMRALAKESGRENVEVISADLVALPEGSRPPDVVWLHLFYHDFHTALLQPLGRGQVMPSRRIESMPAAVREEVETAGFVLDAESTVLANKDDPHSIKLFDPSIKGETDRFAYRFVRL